MGKLIDLTGQNFGLWKVIERGSTKKTSSGSIVYWRCHCECGTEREVRGADLRNGSSTSCGCTRDEGPQDLTNQRFGRLIAICREGKNKYKNITWKCKCDCGNEVIVVSTQLRQGKTKSCGCLQRDRTSEVCRKDITGQRFGKWVALKPSEGHVFGTHIHWDCRCDCGTEASVDIGNLLSGASQSCGCERSRGERAISLLLTENNISFTKEKAFVDLFSPKGYPLRYDFYVKENYLIEFDGQQHFKATESGWSDEECLIQNKIHDQIKNEYCFNHNIPLIRIPYTHLSKLCLEDLLLETSQFIIKRQEI